MKKKKFGKVFAFNYGVNLALAAPGVSIKLEAGPIEDEYDGEWIRLPEAKKLHSALGKAIAYIEESRKAKP